MLCLQQMLPLAFSFSSHLLFLLYLYDSSIFFVCAPRRGPATSQRLARSLRLTCPTYLSIGKVLRMHHLGQVDCLRLVHIWTRTMQSTVLVVIPLVGVGRWAPYLLCPLYHTAPTLPCCPSHHRAEDIGSPSVTGRVSYMRIRLAAVPATHGRG